MRVTGGIYRSRVLKAPKGNATRPTEDRTKEAMFSIIMPFLGMSDVLDIFSGSGALGIEAISRGANSVTFIDNDKNAIDVIKENVESLGITNHTIIFDDYHIISRLGRQFDIIMLDPPYKLDVIDEILYIIDRCNLLKNHGIIVFESNDDKIVKEKEGYRIKNKKYGTNNLSIFYKL